MLRVLKLIVATAATALLLGVPGAEARPCSNFLVGTAYFSNITATNVSCARAKSLLDRTTLTKNRRGALTWYFAGWKWTLAGIDETTNRIRGVRGMTRIRATWSVS